MTAGSHAPNVPTPGVTGLVPPLLHQATGAWSARTLRPDGRGMIDLTGNGRDAIFGGNDAAPTTNDPQALPYDGTRYLYLPGDDNYAAAVSGPAQGMITGDLDLRCAAALADWSTASSQTFISKWNAAPDTSYAFQVSPSSLLRLVWTNAAGASTTINSDLAPAVDGSLLLVRVTLDVDNGTGSHVVRFYTKDSTPNAAPGDLLTDAGWTQLGADVTIAGVTDIRATGAEVRVGRLQSGGSSAAGKFYAAVIKDGIDGTTVLDVDFTLRDVRPPPVSDLLASATGAWRAADVSPSSLRLTDLTGNGHHALFGGNGNQATTNDPLYLPYDGEQYLYLPAVGNTDANTAQVVSSPGFAVADVLTLELDLALGSVTTGMELAGRDATFGLYTSSTGGIRLNYRIGATHYFDAGAPHGMAAGQRARLRVTRDPTSGLITYTRSDDGGATWIALGSPTGTAGPIDDTGTKFAIGHGSIGVGDATASFYAVTLKDGATTVLDIDFTSAVQFPDGGATTTGTAATGHTVTINRATAGRKSVMVERPTLLLGTDDYLTVPSHSDFDVDASTDMTVVMVWRHHGHADAFRFLLRRLSSSGGYYDLQTLNTAGRVYPRLGDGVNPAANVNGGQWVDAGIGELNASAFTVDRTNQLLRTANNGTFAVTEVDTTPVGSTGSDGDLFIGQNGVGGQHLAAELYGVAVFVGQVLTGAQIDAVAAELAAPAASPPAPDGWDPFRRDLVSGGQFVRINRATTGRRAVMVERPTLLLGTDDYLAAGSPADFAIGSGPFTAVAVFRQFATPTSVPLLDTKNYTSTAPGWTMGPRADGNTLTAIADGTLLRSVQITAAISAGEVQTMALLADPSVPSVIGYVDGQFSGNQNGAVVAPITNTTALTFGHRGDLVGIAVAIELFGVAVFVGRTLTAAEIDQIATELAPNRG